MDPPYTPYEDLPAKLRKEMQKLQECKDRVIIQARRVVDVAVTEWQEADARAELTAAALRQVRALTNDCEECPGAVREGDAEKAAFLYKPSPHHRRRANKIRDDPSPNARRRATLLDQQPLDTSECTQ